MIKSLTLPADILSKEEIGKVIVKYGLEGFGVLMAIFSEVASSPLNLGFAFDEAKLRRLEDELSPSFDLMDFIAYAIAQEALSFCCGFMGSKYVYKEHWSKDGKGK